MWNFWVLTIFFSLYFVDGFRFPLKPAVLKQSVNRTVSSGEVRLHLAPSRHSFQPKIMRRVKFLDAKTANEVDKGSEAQKHLLTSTTRKYPLKVIIAGAPAAGKGTQCEVIKSRYGLIHLSTGDILRAAVKAGTPLGLQAKAFMDAGKLVPDELIIGVVCDRLKQSDCVECGWLLDGFPRTKAQADALQAAGMVPDCFVLLDVPEAVLVERVTGRRTDPVTGKIYHLRFNPPENEEVAARLIQRSDDTEEKIKVRYYDFQSNINAIKSSYLEKMVAVDGSIAQSEVSFSVCSSLDAVIDHKIHGKKVADGRLC